MNKTQFSRLEEVKDFLKRSYNAISKELGLKTPQVFYDIKAGKSSISYELARGLQDKFLISSSWLLTGEGEMLLEEKEDKPKLIPSNPQEGIPLIPASAMAGALLGFQEIDHSELTFYTIPSFRGAEYLISISGDSMIPNYRSGDLVACRNVPLNNIFFQWGKTYVLDTEQGALIKRVEHAEEEDSVLLVSENPKYKPFSIPISEIYHVAMIIGLIRGE